MNVKKPCGKHSTRLTKGGSRPYINLKHRRGKLNIIITRESKKKALKKEISYERLFYPKAVEKENLNKTGKVRSRLTGWSVKGRLDSPT